MAGVRDAIDVFGAITPEHLTMPLGACIRACMTEAEREQLAFVIAYFEVEVEQRLGVATLGQLLDPDNNVEGLAERIMDVCHGRVYCGSGGGDGILAVY